MTGAELDAIEVIVPNLSLRYSGVTATNRMIAPRIADAMKLAWFGSDAPEGLRSIRCDDLWRLRRRPAPGGPRIWHARRNVEMIAGLLLKQLGWPLALVFTSVGQRQQKALTRWLIAQMDAVIAPSAASASYVQRTSTVIHHGIDAERHRPPADRAAAWREAGLPGRFGIGCFGRIRKQKGTDVFVAAMCRLLPRYPDFTAVVIGEVTLDQRAFEASLKADVARAGLSERILFLGYRAIDELPEWYRRISIFAFCSRNEGFGLTLLEAMAAETAVVATRAGGAEVVIADGDTGLLVPPGDVEAAVSALETLMRAPERAVPMGQRARVHVVAEFTADAEAARIAALYRQVQSVAAQ